MRAPLVLALALALALVAVAPLASAGPEIPRDKLPQCEDALGEPKCAEIQEKLDEIFLCTCPPW